MMRGGATDAQSSGLVRMPVAMVRTIRGEVGRSRCADGVSVDALCRGLNRGRITSSKTAALSSRADSGCIVMRMPLSRLGSHS